MYAHVNKWLKKFLKGGLITSLQPGKRQIEIERERERNRLLGPPFTYSAGLPSQLILSGNAHPDLPRAVF
jgi:hypothetical protein